MENLQIKKMAIMNRIDIIDGMIDLLDDMLNDNNITTKRTVILIRNIKGLELQKKEQIDDLKQIKKMEIKKEIESYLLNNFIKDVI